ncbi:conserved hypothetical protein, partial [Trichinella spiralis]
TAGRWPWKLESAKECILVVVANIQVRTLKAEVEQGSM